MNFGKISIIVSTCAVAFLLSGCNSVLISKPADLEKLPANFENIRLKIKDINATEAGKAGNYTGYREDIYKSLINNSGGQITDQPGQPLHFKNITLRCSPPKLNNFNDTGHVILEIIFPPLLFVKDYSRFDYIIDYEIRDANNDVVLKKYMRKTVNGYSQGECNDKLLEDQGKFISQNTALLILKDIRRHSAELTEAVKNAEFKKIRLVQERQKKAAEEKLEAEKTKKIEAEKRKKLWAWHSSLAADALAKGNVKKAVSILEKAKSEGLGGDEPQKRLDEIFKQNARKNKKEEKPVLIKNAYPASRCWAVIIGVSKYKYANGKDLTNLNYADNDALKFKDSLLKLGWEKDHIKCLTDKSATKKNIEEALSGWLTHAGSKDLIVLFWSGHGYPDPGDMRKVYFACYDTIISKPYTGWRMDKVVEALKERNARNVVIIADSCHAGKLATKGNEKGIAVRPFIEQLKKDKAVSPGWIYFTSSAPDRKAIEDETWKNGILSHCIITGLSGKADLNRNGSVSMRELKNFLEAAMPDETYRILGAARHPVILADSSDESIWNLTLEAK